LMSSEVSSDTVSHWRETERASDRGWTLQTGVDARVGDSAENPTHWPSLHLSVWPNLVAPGANPVLFLRASPERNRRIHTVFSAQGVHSAISVMKALIYIHY